MVTFSHRLPPVSTTRPHRGRRWVASATAAMMLTSLLVATDLPGPASATAAPGPRPPAGTSVPVSPVQAKTAPSPDSDRAAWRAPAAVRWPSPESTVVDLSGAVAAGSRTRAAAAKPPVTVVPAAAAAGTRAVPGGAPVTKASLRVLDRAATARAGVAGLLVTVARADAGTAAGDVSVEVDYAGFAHAYGGNWAARLTAVKLPACAVSTPQVAGCLDGQPLTVSNDVEKRRLVATVPLAAGPGSADRAAPKAGRDGGPPESVVAFAAAPESPSGTFEKTDLKDVSSWKAGLPTGEFTWSYPMRVPPAPGDLEPSVSLDYSSAGVDGKTNGAGVQTSWIGEGWDYSPGFVERSYRPCEDDRWPSQHYSNATQDPCFRGNNATVSLPGHSGELVYDDASQRWRLSSDDGSRVELLYHCHDHTHAGECWKLTTTEGTQFFFGRQRLPGWKSGAPETNSVLGTQVFSNNSTDPCFSSAGFHRSRCFMAYRWNLDHVVDARGNSMSYWYHLETNLTGLAGSAHDVAGYDRSAHLDHIDYGTRVGSEYDHPAPARVQFAVEDRCLHSCWSGSHPNKHNWPDTPWDLRCTSAPCHTNRTPSFWSTKRLHTVTTKTWNGSSYAHVDEWRLPHAYLETGESAVSPALWLAGIVHLGKANGGEQRMPSIDFGGNRYPNRTDGDPGAGRPWVNKWRLTSVKNQFGGRTEVHYEHSDCHPSHLPDPDHNNRRCFPQWSPGHPSLTWWNRYRVKMVIEKDLVGGSPDQWTGYDYSTEGSSTDVLWRRTVGSAAVWSTEGGKRTWADFVGWSTVAVTTGSNTDVQSHSTYRYFRGMNGDATDHGWGKRGATISGSDGVNLVDHDYLRGFLRERVDYDGPGGKPLTKTTSTPWWHQTSTSTSVLMEPATLTGGFLRTAKTRSSVWINATSSWRTSESTTGFDPTYGTESHVDDAGDIAVPGDETCTRYTNARNTLAWIVKPVARTETVSVPCASTPNYPRDLVEDERKYFDGSDTFGTPPVRGDVTRTEEAAARTGTEITYQTASTAGHDNYGRLVTSGDALGRTTRTSFTPTDGLVRSFTSTNPAGHVTTTVVDPAWGLALTVTDPNGKVMTGSYDAMGRLRKVWHPGRPLSATPNAEYEYVVSGTSPSYTITKKLNAAGHQVASLYEILDGLLQVRQQQTPAPSANGGRMIVDTRYDPRGAAVRKSTFHNGSDPSGSLVSFADGHVNEQIRSTYDTMGRRTSEQLWSREALQHKSTTTHDGDRVTTTPPAGGTAKTTFTDLRGNIVRLRQFLGANPTGDFQDTTYRFDPLDRLTGVTDPAGNDWTTRYDLRGRPVTATDPDKGTTTATFDAADQKLTSTDARGTTVATTYDDLGRPTGRHLDSPTGTKLAGFVYDTIAKGHPTSSTRYAAGNAYTTAVTGYDDGYRPLGTAVTIPVAEGGLAGTYTTGMTYNVDASVATTTYPAVGKLPEETVTHTYDNVGKPLTAIGAAPYLAATTYWPWGAPFQKTSGEVGKRVMVTATVTESTKRLRNLRTHTENQSTGGSWDEKLTEQYYYDPAGNLTSITEEVNWITVANQCFQYDGLRRLTEAFSTTNWQCPDKPSTATVGAPNPYWTSWGYDAVGNRTRQVKHNLTGGADTDTTYNYPTPGTPRAHAVTDTVTTGPGARKEKFDYDAVGNTSGRAGADAAHKLIWDAEGRLASHTVADKTYTYLYQADGTRLLRNEPGGAATLFLGNQELARAADGKVSARRYYETAVRSDDGELTWLSADHHNTGQVAVNAKTLAVTRRQYTPFGETRGPVPTWPTNKGFINGEADPTGLTHLGAREYDPAAGRFISVDPVQDLKDPQQWNGYAYANNNPTTMSDPTGLAPKAGPRCLIECRKAQARQRAAALARQRAAAAELAAVQREAAAANAVKNRSLKDIIVGAGAEILLEVFGIGAVMRCIGGDLLGCGETLVNLIPFARILSIGRIVGAINDGLRAYKVWRQSAAAAENVLRAVPERLNTARKKVEEAQADVAKASQPAGGSCPIRGRSFDPATPVLLKNGTTKAIKDIAVGDRVVATEPKTGRVGARAVTALHLNIDTNLTDLYLRTGKGAVRVVRTSQNHPFWDETAKRWVDAGDLVRRHRLRTPNGASTTVVRVHNYTGTRAMHDLTVADIHTYYVMAGNTPVLVHNCGKNQGVYEFPDQLNPGNTYVGKTNNFDRRLQHWIDEGRLRSRSDATCTHVCGTDDDLFVAEHRRMEELRKQGVPLSNEKASPGKSILERRQYEQLELW